MKWSEMSEKDKVKHIIVDVMKWECLDSFADWLAEIKRTGEYTGESVQAREAIAFYDGKGDVGSRDQWYVSLREGCEPIPFDPLHDMNDAWRVMERFPYVLVARLGKHVTVEIRNPDAVTHIDAENAQEAILKAALIAVGVEIEP
jgi:hypothetical protein